MNKDEHLNKSVEPNSNIKETIISHCSKHSLYNEDKHANTDSWEWSNSIQSRLINDSSAEYPWAESLEDEWKVLSEYQTFNNLPIFPRESFQKSHKTPLKAFLTQMENGFYPPPEILLTIADSFNIYFMSEGEVGLEEAFFGLPKKGIGNYSARLSAFDKYKKFYVAYRLRLLFKDKKKISLTKFAEDYFYNKINPIFEGLQDSDGSELIIYNENHNEGIDIDNFLRGFRRWRKALKKSQKEDN
jgi:hypothetical protein